MTTAAIYAALLPQVNTAGQWLIRRLVRWGVPRVIAFLEMRIDTLADRRARLSKRKAGKKTRGRKARLAWLAWRVGWRRKLLGWLKSMKSKLTARLLKAAEKTYEKAWDRIPWNSVGERFETWTRRRA